MLFVMKSTLEMQNFGSTKNYLQKPQKDKINFRVETKIFISTISGIVYILALYIFILHKTSNMATVRLNSTLSAHDSIRIHHRSYNSSAAVDG